MFEVSVEYSFAAGHALREYKGKCENVHGHNYKVKVVVAGERLNSVGLLVDFVDIRKAIKSAGERLDHRFLNDIEPFDRLNPSAENIALYFAQRLEPQLKNGGIYLKAVTIWESDGASATYRPDGQEPSTSGTS